MWHFSTGYPQERRTRALRGSATLRSISTARREWRSEQPQRSGGEDSQAKNRPAEYLPRTRGGHTPRSEVPHFLGLPGGMGRHAAPGPSGGSGVRKLGTNDITTPNAPTEHGFTRRQHPWMSSALPEGGGRRKAAAPSPMVVKEMRRRVRGIYRSGCADELRVRFRFGQLSGHCRRVMKVFADQSRVDSEIPSWCAFTAVAPAVRFSAFEILATPILFLARDLNSRKSEAVHERRTIFFFLAGIIGSLVEGARLLTQPPRLAMPTFRASARQQ
jgi:hypothetical protein